ncbi:MAG: polysaccharide biosynthesis tyrosine autokinase, partial [Saprospiraceae bacterium]|nr:polysaccharide biosynthesis tyrosine autokinase [Saprospiraceae bacterium]
MSSQDKNLDVKNFIDKYVLQYLYINILFLFLTISGAYLYLRYAIPKFEAKTTILIKSEKQKSGISEEKLLGELGILNPDVNLENEIQILKSRTMMEQVVDELGLNVSYYGVGRITENEIYKESPISVDSFDIGLNNKVEFKVSINSDNTLNLKYGDSIFHVSQDLVFQNNIGFFRFKINTSIPWQPKQEIIISIVNTRALATSLARKIIVVNVGDFSNVLELRLIDPIGKKAVDILNKLIEIYNNAAIEDKNKISANTLKFIEGRLFFLTQELGDVEKDIESFKRKNKIPMSIETTAKSYSENTEQYQKDLSSIAIQIEILLAVQENMKSSSGNFNYIPTNIGINNQSVSTLFEKFNDLLIEKERLSRSGTNNNPKLLTIEAQIDNIRQNIVSAIQDELNNLKLTKLQLEKKVNQLSNFTNSIPKFEREFLEIYRQQNIKESLYLFLLQKREETALSMAVTPNSARVLDAAMVNAKPVEPKKTTIYLIALMLGLGIPIIVISVISLLNDKLYYPTDIENEIDTPIIGTIMQNKKEKQIIVSKNDKSASAEMFRLLRTNLQFMLGPGKSKTILITSSVSGEGKTYIAVNLGVSIALSGKKTILLGLDLRKPKLKSYLVDKPEDVGITNFLISDLGIDDVIFKTEINDNLYFIPSGPVPPNPSELILSKKMDELMEILQSRFEVIIIDTPPVGLVADALLLNKYIDTSIFVIRSGQSRKTSLRLIEDLYKNSKLKSLGIVFNGMKTRNRYGYGYGYG